jgi:hypothetical protein
VCIACSYFPPTKDLEQWLLSYIKEQLKLEDLKLRAYAAYCLRRLPKVCSLGARGRVPTVKEIERTKVRRTNTGRYLIIIANTIIDCTIRGFHIWQST